MTHTLHEVTTLKREQDTLKEKYGIRFYNRPLLQSFDQIEHVLATKVLPSHIQLFFDPRSSILWASVERTDGDFYIARDSIESAVDSLRIHTQLYQNKTDKVGVDLLRSFPIIDKTAPELRKFELSLTVENDEGWFGTKFRIIGSFVNYRNERIFFGNLRIHTMHFTRGRNPNHAHKRFTAPEPNVVTDIKIRSINWSPNA